MPLQLALERDVDGAGPIEARGWAYLGERPEWRIAAERGALAQIPREDLSDRLQELAQQLRGEYLDWIGELSQLNASVDWWATELASKSAYTLLFNRICNLACVLERIDGLDEMLVVAATEGQLAEVEAAARRVGLPTRRLRAPTGRTIPWSSLAARALNAWTTLPWAALRNLPPRLSTRAAALLDASPRYRLRVAGAARRQIASGGCMLFTWVDARSFAADGSYHDAFFGDVPAALEALGLPVTFVARVLPALPYARAHDALEGSGVAAILPEAYLSLEDWREALRRSRAYTPSIPEASTVGPVPAARLAREHVDQYRWAHALSLVYEPFMRNLAAAGAQPERIVHTFEGHAWEQVMTAAARSAWPGVRIVGYENANMSRLALSMFPARAELDLRPLPDLAVTNGPQYRTVLLDEGWPPERVVAGCAVRHGYLAEVRAPATRTKGDRVRVLAATDAAFGAAVELVDKALEAFGGDGRYELVIKPHPLLDAARLEAALPALAGVTVARGPLAEELDRADLLLYSYSIVPYEALAHGVPPIFVRAEASLDLDQLEPFPDTRWTARTPAELRAAAEAVAALGDEERDAWRSRARAAVDSALAPPSAGCVEAFAR